MANLYIIPEDKWVDPKMVEKSDLILNAKRKWTEVNFNKVIKTIDIGINEILKNESDNTIIWVDAGALVGTGDLSKQQLKRVEQIWDEVSSLVANNIIDPIATKIVRKTIGTFIKWRISIREETFWLVTYIPIGKKDPVTGEEIYASKYWIEPKYKKKETGFSKEDLKAKFSKGGLNK